ncbi:MAG TPA: hemerythrin domain-containing protein, partial [Bacteroidia bacterium]|nr:hemerythrin domain-containing protein [Bacteroidia bacterium]
NDWNLDFLADYIVNTHHTYVKNNLPEISGYAAKVARVHGSNHPELLRINQLVEAISSEFSSHLVKEEQVLFPYIKRMVEAKNNKESVQQSSFGSVKGPINMMEIEHESAGKNMSEIRTLSNDFTLPEDACASYSLLFRLLEEFEEDLHTHVHLENNILFPKALALEKELVTK